MKLYALAAVIAFICSASYSAAVDIYVWTDENGVKHYSNQEPPQGAIIILSAADQQKMSPPLKAPAETDPSPDERVDKEVNELKRLLEELQQQLEANRRVPADEALPEIPNPETSAAESFQPRIEPFGGYDTFRSRYVSRYYYPYTLCYPYGRYFRGYTFAKSHYAVYPGPHRRTYRSSYGHIGKNHHIYRQPRYGHNLKSHRFTHRGQRYGKNRIHHRSHRSGASVRVRAGGNRAGVRIGHRR